MLSVIIPIFNEVENITPLHNELREVLDTLESDFEIIYVDDGSRDGSFDLLRQIAESDEHVQVVQFRRNFGQTAALAAGIDAAQGDVLIFMDGDRQNDPHSIPAMLERLGEGFDVVSGWRKNRQDAALSRKLPSRMANSLISKVSGVPLHDYGCTLKAYRREVIENVRLYGEMHRFIPAYAAWYGARITEMPVGHRARVAGKSKYGISRTMRVVLDLMTLKFLSDYSTKPIYLFGGWAAFFGLVGALTWLYTVGQRLFGNISFGRNIPLIVLGLSCFIAALFFLFMGLLAELVTRTYHESQHKQTYAIRTHLGKKDRGRRPTSQDPLSRLNGSTAPAHAEPGEASASTPAAGSSTSTRD
jgi:glycosyltransferase involved in cell wall biosynthesis